MRRRTSGLAPGPSRLTAFSPSPEEQTGDRTRGKKSRFSVSPVDERNLARHLKAWTKQLQTTTVREVQ